MHASLANDYAEKVLISSRFLDHLMNRHVITPGDPDKEKPARQGGNRTGQSLMSFGRTGPERAGGLF